jgi:hypothetical protein
MILLVIGSVEVLAILGYLLILVLQGPRGIVGQFAHIAFSGRAFPTPPAESSRIFWTSTGQILAVEFVGLLVVFAAWKLLKRLPPQA